MKTSHRKSGIFFYLIVLLVIFITTGTASADFSMENKFSLFISAGARQPSLNPTSQPWVISPAYSIGAGYGINEEVMLICEFEYGKVYNDSISKSVIKIGNDNANEYWKISTAKVKIKYSLIGNSPFVPYVTGGTGLAFWSIRSNYTGDKLEVEDGDGNNVGFSATEMLLSGGLGLEYFFRKDMSIYADATFNYLTGLGTDFSQTVNDQRSHAYGDVKFGVSLYFGLEKGEMSISYEEPGTETGEEEGRIEDDDLDGVPNAIDLCPDTPPEGRGMVDEYGCPIDSDKDGLPDYRDRCPHTYAVITPDSTGCPPDHDMDNIPDSIDACPDTPRGYPVDSRGCAEMDSIFTTRTMYIRFSESGRGIDLSSLVTLDNISRALIDFPKVRAAIKAYTDNSMGLEKSKQQAEIKASKIKSYLMERGVSGERIDAVGVGAADFIDTNTTPEGRARNNRIVIEFNY
jgi:outer membrane protein OmpA-like peptidoglycan-associated protein